MPWQHDQQARIATFQKLILGEHDSCQDINPHNHGENDQTCILDHSPYVLATNITSSPSQAACLKTCLEIPLKCLSNSVKDLL